jgi:hypothetical protein
LRALSAKLKHPLDATVYSAQKCWFHMLAGGSTFRQGVDLYLHGRVIPAFNPGEESTDRISLADRGVPDRGLVLCETFWSRHEVRLARRPKHVILDLPSTSTPSSRASFMLDDRAQRRGREHEPCTTHAPLSLTLVPRVVSVGNSKAHPVRPAEHRPGHQARRTERASGEGG